MVKNPYTADSTSIGFDYQFYYFVYLLLQMQNGDKIGFEILDDIHIELCDSKTILFQTKHTVATSSNGEATSLTSLDSDLWKTIAHWVEFLSSKSADTINSNYEFRLVTNKIRGANVFIEALNEFKIDNDLQKVKTCFDNLNKTTSDKTIQAYLSKIQTLSDKKLCSFLSVLVIDTKTDDLINKIKDRLRSLFIPDDRIDRVFESLCANLFESKYIEIKNRRKFEITHEDFRQKYRKCFEAGFAGSHLPIRNLPCEMPDNPRNQVFIRQLIDVDDIQTSDTESIYEYTRTMLKAKNELEAWLEHGDIIPTEETEFEEDAILRWKNRFKSCHREIMRKHDRGESIDLEEARQAGRKVLEEIRLEHFPVCGQLLGMPFCNGYYYILSNMPRIGWHYQWQKRYQVDE